MATCCQMHILFRLTIFICGFPRNGEKNAIKRVSGYFPRKQYTVNHAHTYDFKHEPMMMTTTTKMMMNLYVVLLVNLTVQFKM